jgi:glutamate racemase
MGASCVPAVESWHGTAVGVFDSGLGGVSVLHAMRQEMPHEHFVYVADSGFAPYGDQSEAFVVERAQRLMDFMMAARVKAVVIACNTATVLAVQALRARYDIPIIAMEPAIKPAVHATRTGVVGVLATSRTIASASVRNLCDTFGHRARIMPMACPGLVDCVEEGIFTGQAVDTLLETYLRPLVEAGADTLVLGCTHYVFLREAIQKIAGPTVQVIDSSAAVARHAAQRISALQKASPSTQRGRETFYTTGPLHTAQQHLATLWKADAAVYPLPSA